MKFNSITIILFIFVFMTHGQENIVEDSHLPAIADIIQTPILTLDDQDVQVSYANSGNLYIFPVFSVKGLTYRSGDKDYPLFKNEKVDPVFFSQANNNFIQCSLQDYFAIKRYKDDLFSRLHNDIPSKNVCHPSILENEYKIRFLYRNENTGELEILGETPFIRSDNKLVKASILLKADKKQILKNLDIDQLFLEVLLSYRAKLSKDNFFACFSFINNRKLSFYNDIIRQSKKQPTRIVFLDTNNGKVIQKKLLGNEETWNSEIIIQKRIGSDNQINEKFLQDVLFKLMERSMDFKKASDLLQEKCLVFLLENAVGISLSVNTIKEISEIVKKEDENHTHKIYETLLEKESSQKLDGGVDFFELFNANANSEQTGKDKKQIKEEQEEKKRALLEVSKALSGEIKTLASLSFEQISSIRNITSGEENVIYQEFQYGIKELKMRFSLEVFYEQQETIKKKLKEIFRATERK